MKCGQHSQCFPQSHPTQTRILLFKFAYHHNKQINPQFNIGENKIYFMVNFSFQQTFRKIIVILSAFIKGSLKNRLLLLPSSSYFLPTPLLFQTGRYLKLGQQGALSGGSKINFKPGFVAHRFFNVGGYFQIETFFCFSKNCFLPFPYCMRKKMAASLQVKIFF